MLGLRLLVVAMIAASASPVFAHGSHAGPLGWTVSPELVIPLFLGLVIYVIGWARLSKRASTGSCSTT